MRLLCGASESVVNRAVSPAILSRTLVAFGSTADTMIALTPAAARLSISVCCDATVACAGYSSSILKSGSSFCAAATPAPAAFQKSDAPLVTNASVGLSAACAPLTRPKRALAATPARMRLFITFPPLRPSVWFGYALQPPASGAEFRTGGQRPGQEHSSYYHTNGRFAHRGGRRNAMTTPRAG